PVFPYTTLFRSQLVPPQRVDQTALEHRSLAEPARQPFLDQMVGARVHRAAHLGAEPAVRDAHAALDQAMVQPGRTGRLDLRRQVEVRSRCEDQARLRLAGLADRAQLDDAAE